MTCGCGGKYMWRQQQSVKSDIDEHRIKVNIFACDSCGRFFITDTERKKILSDRECKPHIPTLTDEEKQIRVKHKINEKDLKIWLKDVKKQAEIVKKYAL